MNPSSTTLLPWAVPCFLRLGSYVALAPWWSLLFVCRGVPVGAMVSRDLALRPSLAAFSAAAVVLFMTVLQEGDFFQGVSALEWVPPRV